MSERKPKGVQMPALYGLSRQAAELAASNEDITPEVRGTHIGLLALA